MLIEKTKAMNKEQEASWASLGGCICEGNWRKIIAEHNHLFGKSYVHNGELYKFDGIVWGQDDFYYLMINMSDRTCHQLTCVGSIEQQGFTLYV